MMNELREDVSWHTCEYCFNSCNVFCGCPGEKKAMQEEMKREIINSIQADLNEMDVQLFVRGEQWL